MASGRKLPEVPDDFLRELAEIAHYPLEVLKQADLDWTNLSPAAMIEPGERTSNYRTGSDILLTDAQGNSRISAEDYAVAMVDELERPKHVRQRFTLAY